MIIRNDLSGATLISIPCVRGLYSYPASTATGASTAIFQSDLRSNPPTSIRGFLASTSGKYLSNTYVGDTPLDTLIHNRIGHLSFGNQKLTSRLRTVYGPKLGQHHKICACGACMRAKMTQSYTRAPASRPTTVPLGRLHYDFVPVPCVATIGDFIGFVIIVDEGTDNVWAIPVKLKSEVSQTLIDFITKSERQFATKVGSLSRPHELTALRSDGGGENSSLAFSNYCRGRGIIHEFSAPYCQWQNGVAERFVRTVWNGSEAMRKHAQMPARYWPYSVQAFTYTWSRLAMGEDDRSPMERWTSTKIPMWYRLAHLRTFGCRCYVHVAEGLRKRLDDKARLALFVGYSDLSKAYLAIDIETGKLLTAVSIAFDETSFPFQSLAAAGVTDPNAAAYEKLMMQVPDPQSTISPSNWPELPNAPANSANPPPLAPIQARAPPCRSACRLSVAAPLRTQPPPALPAPAPTGAPPPPALPAPAPSSALPALEPLSPSNPTMATTFGMPPLTNLFPTDVPGIADDIESSPDVGQPVGFKVASIM